MLLKLSFLLSSLFLSLTKFDSGALCSGSYLHVVFSTSVIYTFSRKGVNSWEGRSSEPHLSGRLMRLTVVSIELELNILGGDQNIMRLSNPRSRAKDIDGLCKAWRSYAANPQRTIASWGSYYCMACSTPKSFT